MKIVIKACLFGVVLITGVTIGIWSLLAFTAGLKQVDWQLTELLRQYLIATGVVKPTHTLVDFYSHIKGVEYLICVAFFVAFPLFFKYVNKDVNEVENSYFSNSANNFSTTTSRSSAALVPRVRSVLICLSSAAVCTSSGA